MSVQRQTCPFHTDDDILGVRNADGAYAFVCDRTHDATGGEFSWLHDPQLASDDALGGLADELGLDVELPAVLAALGEGWFEYGLVERAYALAKPQDFAQMVERWSHTALAPQKYSASSYLAGVLGRLSRAGAIYFHQGKGTGRWAYNTDISYWAIRPADWDARTTWVAVIGDDTKELQEADVECKAYVSGT